MSSRTVGSGRTQAPLRMVSRAVSDEIEVLQPAPAPHTRRGSNRKRSAGASKDVSLLLEVATRFHIQGQSQVEIARALRIDSSTVSRYLKRARDSGLVQVRVAPPQPVNESLGNQLASHFRLARVVVASADEQGRALATAAAEYIDGVLVNGLHVAMSWGSTLLSVVSALRPAAAAELELAQLMGGVGYTAPGVQGHEIVRLMAGLYPDSNPHYLHAPLIVGSAEIKELICRERSIQPALEAATHSDLAIVAIGTMSEQASITRYGHVEPQDRALLIANGAAGDLCGRFFRADGRPALAELDRRTIAIQWDQLRAIPTVVAVAAGRHRCDAIRGALRTGCVDVLVTDEATAELILAAELHPFARGDQRAERDQRARARKTRGSAESSDA